MQYLPLTATQLPRLARTLHLGAPVRPPGSWTPRKQQKERFYPAIRSLGPLDLLAVAGRMVCERVQFYDSNTKYSSPSSDHRHEGMIVLSSLLLLERFNFGIIGTQYLKESYVQQGSLTIIIYCV